MALRISFVVLATPSLRFGTQVSCSPAVGYRRIRKLADFQPELTTARPSRCTVASSRSTGRSLAVIFARPIEGHWIGTHTQQYISDQKTVLEGACVLLP